MMVVCLTMPSQGPMPCQGQMGYNLQAPQGEFCVINLSRYEAYKLPNCIEYFFPLVKVAITLLMLVTQMQMDF